MHEERQRRVARLIRQGLVAWLVFHAFASACLLGAIYKPDAAGVKVWAYIMIGLTPIVIACLYLEARATWQGKADPELGPAIATVSIAAVVGALAWYLG